ncbi:MAG: FHA domain-containing protein [Polyangiaceae bacterium]
MSGTTSSLPNLASAGLVETALTVDQKSFLTLYGDTLILLVRVGPQGGELAQTLGATAPRGREGTAPTPIAPAMDFDTVTYRKDFSAMHDKHAEPEQLTRAIEAIPHFAILLRKRAGGDTAYKDRISVGRARNKDIVLRHQSVSKFHGWFEVDERNDFYFTDADSKNRTRVNGTLLFPRERSPVQSGDTIRFGSVETFLCAPQVFFNAVRTSASKNKAH